jgi:trans-2,3-dihydro-3-hydroxyanthranilate isomerase
MNRRYVTADVFTNEKFKGNSLAIVLDASGLSTRQMQAIAIEFAYSETTFVLPPKNPAHTAQVRIFTPDREIPFAGHPNIGTAFVLASEAAARGQALPDRLVFEELAGLVPVDQIRENGILAGAELTSPEPLSRHSAVSPDRVAACLSLDAADIRLDEHAPQVASVGLPFLVAELVSRDALRRCMPNLQAFKSLLPIDGAFSVYAYTQEVGRTPDEAQTDLQARMFTSRMTEDPATGSATAAAAALVAQVRGLDTLALRIGQGVDMGRPSILSATMDIHEGKARVRIGGKCVRVMEGTFQLAGEA